ncbi:MAG: hypothetical protein WD294_14130 [Phycisphaeraceae bacterium]
MKNLMIVLMCAGLLSVGVGCEQQQRTSGLDDSLNGETRTAEPITVDTVTSDMSPELTTLMETRDEGRVRTARVVDTNTRGIWDDIRNIFLLDRPSRLSLTPIP